MGYPEDISIEKPEAMGKALQAFLAEKGFTAKAAAVGIPVKWVVVKPKEIPAANASTVNEMLRIQAEAEFPSDLKDLIYDFSGEGNSAAPRTVLLMATPRKYVEASESLCRGAGLATVAVTASALALGDATASKQSKNVLVLAMGSGGSELSIRQSGGSSAIRHLRGGASQPQFVGELRRAVSGVPGTADDREMVLWDSAGTDAGTLGDQLGIPVRAGELLSLGVDTSIAGRNGDGSKFAAAVAVALEGLLAPAGAVNFIDSRLAPPVRQRVSRQVMGGAVAVLAVVLVGVLAYEYLAAQQSRLDLLMPA